MKADESQKSHFRLPSRKLWEWPGRDSCQGPKLATGASLLPLQGDTALPTPANLYSHEPQSGPTFVPSSLGFWVRKFVLMATTEKTSNPLPSTVTHTPSGRRFLAKTWPESATRVPGAKGVPRSGEEEGF